MINTFHEYLKEQLQDPEVRAEYPAYELELEKMKAMLRLMHELNEGRRSGEDEGWISEETARAHFLNQSKWIGKVDDIVFF